MADEVNEAFRFVKTRLAADPTFAALNIPVFAADQVPQGQAGLYVIVDFAAGSDVDGAGTNRLMSLPLMFVALTQKGSVDSTMRAGDKAMDSALQSAAVATVGDYVFSMRRERPHRRSYRDGANNLWSESGGYYRAYVA